MKKILIIFLLPLLIFSNCKKENLDKKYMIRNVNYYTKTFKNDSIIEIKESEVDVDTLIIDSTYRITKSIIFKIDNDLNNYMTSVKFYMVGTWTKRENGTIAITNQTYAEPQTELSTNYYLIGGLNTTELFPWPLIPGDYITGSLDWTNNTLLLSSITKYIIPQYHDSIVLDTINDYKGSTYVAFRFQKKSDEYNYGWIAAEVINYRKLVLNKLTYYN